MSSDLMEKAKKLDAMRSRKIAEKLTLEEADKIVHVWGVHLEYSGAVKKLFGLNVPESLLPYPIIIIQGALNKMEAYYFKQGNHDRVKLLEQTEAMLMQYTDDEESINDAIELFSNKKWQEVMIPALKKHQKSQVEAGYIVDGNLWKLSKSRLDELE